MKEVVLDSEVLSTEEYGLTFCLESDLNSASLRVEIYSVFFVDETEYM
jgi:hypothetical protein